MASVVIRGSEGTIEQRLEAKIGDERLSSKLRDLQERVNSKLTEMVAKEKNAAANNQVSEDVTSEDDEADDDDEDGDADPERPHKRRKT